MRAVLLLVVLASLGCFYTLYRQSATRPNRLNPIGSDKVAYPDSWPIKELVVPTSSVRQCIDSILVTNNRDPYAYFSSSQFQETWMVGYWNELGWNQNIDYWEDLIASSNLKFKSDEESTSYKDVKQEMRRLGISRKTKHFSSYDNMTGISLIYDKREYGGYSLVDRQYSDDVPYEGYTLIITRMK